MDINIKLVRPNAICPTYGSESAAGADLYACIEESITVLPGETSAIPTGIATQIPEGYAGFIYARSGLACKSGLAPANKVGVIDADYRGEIVVMLHNHGQERQRIDPNDRVAQFVIAPVVRGNFHTVPELDETGRGSGGFGSTGK